MPIRLLAIGILTGGLLLAQQDAAQLIRQVSETYKNLKSYHFDSDYQSEMTGEWQGSWSKGHSKLMVASPGRVRFEVLDRMGSYIVVSDEKTLWRASANTREYMRSPISGPLVETNGGGQDGVTIMRRLKFAEEQYQRLDENLTLAQILREETFELGGSNIPCTVVRSEYKPPPLAEGIQSITRTFWIDKQRNLVLQDESVTRGKLFPDKPYEQVETRYKTRYTLVSVQENFSDSLFAYTPPEDFREVDALQPPSRRTATADMVGKPAPEFTAKMLDGTPFTLSSLRGKLVLLDFWATWCAPCRDQLPLIAKLYRETRDQGLVLLGVDDDETTQKAIKYLEENHYDWPSLYDGKILAAREKFKVRSIPTLVLIDKQGQIAEYQVGSGSQTEKAIRAALRKQGIQVQ